MLSIILFCLPFIKALGHCDCQQSINVDLYVLGQPLLGNGWHSDTLTDYKSNKLFTIPEGCGESLQVSAILTTKIIINTTGSITSPLGLDQDPYYGYGLLGFSDLSGWSFQFWITNTKVYAYYARAPLTQTIGNFYTSFAYLVPVADREVDSYDEYQVSLSKDSRSVSYRMNGFELLKIDKVGTRIDDKFLIADYGGYFDNEAFPEEVYAVTNTSRDITIGPVPHAACQRTLYYHCLDNIRNAKRTECQYNMLPGQSITSIFPVATSIVNELVVSSIRNVETCPQWTCDKRRPANQLFKRLAKTSVKV